MKRGALAIVVAGILSACASLTPQGEQVKVYQAEVAKQEDPTPPLPAGCKLLGTTGPIDQEQQDREISDPYRSQRNQTAGLGGNVLYLRSYRFMNLMKTDCPVGDTSPGCMSTSQNWYKVTFESYACDAAALTELARSPQPSSPGVFRWELKKKTPAPGETAAVEAVPTPSPAPRAALAVPGAAAALKSKIVALMQEGVGADVIVAYVRANRLASALTAEEIIDWKKAGISDAIIRATFPN
jgi:hypothetical protein